MSDVAKLRPRETGIMASNPAYRQMDHVVAHAGLCRRLDCWRVETSRRNPDYKFLKDYALTKPSLQDLETIADCLTRQYVADWCLACLCRQPTAQRDQQHEHSLLFNQYSLLYEEIGYVMNQGDIGWLELVLPFWIFIFHATSKHRYACHMTVLLSNFYFVYPEGLKKAIRYNILVNLTGKPGEFRAVD